MFCKAARRRAQRCWGDLAKAQAEASLRAEELVKSRQRSNLQRLVAPVDGTVAQLAVHTIGGVVEPAKPIMVIVPKGGELIAEVKLLIVLDLNGDGVSLTDNRATSVAYDWDGDGRADQTGWISRTDGFLVYDRNGDGGSSNGSELSFTSDKEGAKSDLDGLCAFDSNADGQFSADDEKFDQFKIWQDRNGDGRAGLGEMLSLEDAGVASINLGGEAVNRNWAWGENITINSGNFTRTNGTTGGVGDVALSYEVQRTAGNVLPGHGGRLPGYWNRFASIRSWPVRLQMPSAGSRKPLLLTSSAERKINPIASKCTGRITFWSGNTGVDCSSSEIE
jgi:hypothetical protein